MGYQPPLASPGATTTPSALSMKLRSAARAISSKVPAKHDPVSTRAMSVLAVRSRRLRTRRM
jgi:hypothetical protein